MKEISVEIVAGSKSMVNRMDLKVRRSLIDADNFFNVVKSPSVRPLLDELFSYSVPFVLRYEEIL
jgi:hypothetical protein